MGLGHHVAEHVVFTLRQLLFLSLSLSFLPSSFSPRASFSPHPIHRCHSLIPRFFVGSPAYRVHTPARAPISHGGTHVSLLGCSFVRSRFLSPLLVIERRGIQQKLSRVYIYVYTCTRERFRGSFEAMHDYVQRHFSKRRSRLKFTYNCKIEICKHECITIMRFDKSRYIRIFNDEDRSKVRRLAKLMAHQKTEKSLFFVSPFTTAGDK